MSVVLARSRVGQAWDATPALHGWRRKAISGFGAFVAVAAALGTWGSDTAFPDYLLAAVVGFTAGLLPSFFEFAYNFVKVPIRAAEAANAALASRVRALEQASDERAAKETEAKHELRAELSAGAYLRKQVHDGVRSGGPIGPWVGLIDNWIFKTQVALEKNASDFVAFFVTDTGDKPVAPGYSQEGFGEYQSKINIAHLERFDRHLERLREIVYERL